MIICACCGRASAFPIHPQRACPLNPKTSAKWLTVLWPCPRAHAAICWRPWCVDVRVNIKKKCWNGASRAFSACALMAKCMKLMTPLPLIKSSSTISKWWSIALWCARGWRPALPTVLRPRFSFRTGLRFLKPRPKKARLNRLCFQSASPAPYRALRLKRLSHGCFRSTTRLAPAPRATVWVKNFTLTPNWWCLMSTLA